jgi:hypothetical protein
MILLSYGSYYIWYLGFEKLNSCLLNGLLIKCVSLSEAARSVPLCFVLGSHLESQVDRILGPGPA